MPRKLRSAASSVSATLITLESRMLVPAPLPRSSGHGLRNPPWRTTPSLAKATDSIMLPFGIARATARPLNRRWQLARWPRTPACIGDRSADHAQDLGSRGLPLERLVRLVEQSRILDGDQRLVAEGFGERDLIAIESVRLACERASWRRSTSPSRSSGIAERRADASADVRTMTCRSGSSIASQSGMWTVRFQTIACDGKLLRHVDREPAPCTARWRFLRALRARSAHTNCRPRGRTRRNRSRAALTAVRHDRIEHGLRVGRRRADDAQDVGRRRLPSEGALRLVEEARVVQRDRGLARQSGQELELALVERLAAARQTAIAPSIAPSAPSGTTMRRSSLCLLRSPESAGRANRPPCR